MALTVSSTGNWYHATGTIASVVAHLSERVVAKERVVGATGDGTNLHVTYGKF